MVMIYQPNYFDLQHPYCAREYLAMEQLETRRRTAVGTPTHDGLIIPVIFRGLDTLSQEIIHHRQYEDFSSFLLHDADLLRHPHFSVRVSRMADYIYKQCGLYEGVPAEFSAPESFRFPEEADAIEWMRKSVKSAPVLPGRR